MNTGAAFTVDHPSQVSLVRGAVHRLAQRQNFSEARAGQAALIVTELATNLAKHAVKGEILMRALGSGHDAGEPPGLEVLSIDAGPGMPDLAMSRRDGYSTTGTPGEGLGVVGRQADFFEIYSDLSGTVALARIWRDERAAHAGGPLHQVGGIHVSKAGEDVCGDAWSWRAWPERLVLFLADGLGHGLGAHEAAETAVKAFEAEPAEAPNRIVADAHEALRPTRGAAVAVFEFDVPRGLARFSGLGNISGAILPVAGGRQSLVSHNGTAGVGNPRVREFSYPVPRSAVIVLHSDGLGTHWDLGKYPGLRNRHPSVIAGVLYRDFSRQRDDVTVVVITERRA